MDIMHRGELLELLKAVADETRLKMVGLMHQQERTVTEMAGLLELTEPTISHHVSKLHNVGFLRLRMAGTQRFYQLNEIRLAKFKAYINTIEALPEESAAEKSDDSWINALNWGDDDKKILRIYTRNGKLLKLPLKDKHMVVVSRWLAMLFQPSIRYSEKEVNAILTQIHGDYATLRRSLVEYGFMRRERGGGDYWLTPENESGK